MRRNDSQMRRNSSRRRRNNGRRKENISRAERRRRRLRARRRKTVVLCSLSLFMLVAFFYWLGEKEPVPEVEKQGLTGASYENGTKKAEKAGKAGKADAAPEEAELGKAVKSGGKAADIAAEVIGKARSDVKKNGIIVPTPMKRTKAEVLSRLKELGGYFPEIQKIYDNSADYPEEMLEALANNPEMAEFVSGYLTASQKVSGSLTELEKNQEWPLFLQWDERWGYVSYGDNSNIGLSGCGPTCLSMVAYYITRDARMTPDVMAKYAMANGYYVSGTGTAWLFMEEAARHFGLRASKVSKSEAAMKEQLKKGHPIICAMGRGDFTAAGHFIVIYGYDEEGFLVNDPNCLYRSGKKWPYEQIQSQIKSIWAYR